MFPNHRRETHCLRMTSRKDSTRVTIHEYTCTRVNEEFRWILGIWVKHLLVFPGHSTSLNRVR